MIQSRCQERGDKKMITCEHCGFTGIDADFIIDVEEDGSEDTVAICPICVGASPITE